MTAAASPAAPAPPGGPAPSPYGAIPPPWVPAPPAPPPRRSRALLYGAVGAVVVVILLLLSLAALGVLPWFQNNGASALSFSQARTAAQSSADSYAGGPWTLVAAVEAVPSASMTLPINSTVGNVTPTSSGCAFTQLAQGSLTISGSQNVSGGLANEWVFLFRGAGGVGLFVSDDAGSVQLVGTVTGSVCSLVFDALNPIPTSVEDSPAAAATVGAAGGYAFLRAHPNANATAEISDGLSLYGYLSIPAQWTFTYSTCPISLGGGLTPLGSGETFTANVSLTTGALLGSSVGACGSPITPPPGSGAPVIGTDVAFSASSEATAGPTYWYNFSVVYASGTLPFTDLQFAVDSASGVAIPLAAPSLEFLSSGGVVAASYNLASHAWISTPGTLVQGGETLMLRTTTALAASGDDLVVTGTPGLATGSIFVAIP